MKSSLPPSYSKTTGFGTGLGKVSGLGKFPGKAAESGEKVIRMGTKKKGCKSTPSGNLNILLACVFFNTIADAVGWIQQIADGTVVV